MKPKFGLGGSLVNASQVAGWDSVQLDLSVMDKEGIYLLTDVLVGDLVLVDASASEGGVTAKYSISSIVSRSGTALKVNASYIAEAGVAAPDLSWCLGAFAVVTRPDAKGVIPILAPGVQGMADKLAFASVSAGMAALAAALDTTTALPTGGAEGDVITRTAGGGLAWQAPAGGAEAPASGIHYYVVLCTGQSNMSGRGGSRDARLDPVNDRLYAFDAAGSYALKITQAVEPMGSSDVAIGAGVSYGPATTFGRHLADSLPAGSRVLLLPCGYGGLASVLWQSGYQMDVECQRVLNAAIAAIVAEGSTWELAAVVWHQGESDSDNTAGPAYAASLASIINRMRTAYPGATSTTPFVVGGLMPEFVASPPAPHSTTGAAAVQAALVALPTAVAYTGYAACPSGYPQDAYHISAAGHRILGKRLFDAYIRAKANALVIDPPGQVTGLAASNVLATSLTLAWSAPSSGGTPNDYLIEFKPTSGSTWTTFADGTSITASVSVTGLSASTAYDFRVRAANTAGTGAYSTTVSATTAAGTVAPGQPTGLTGTAAPTSVALSWVAPSSGNAATDYTVEYKLSSGSTWTTLADGVSVTPTATVTGLTNSTSYDFRVKASNAGGTGVASSVFTISTTAAVTAPNQVTGLTGTAASNSVALAWSAPGNGGSAITDYIVEYKLSSGGTWANFADGVSTGTTATVTGLTASTSYDFRVSAINAIGTGVASSLFTVSTAAAAFGFSDTFNRANGAITGTTETGGKAWNGPYWNVSGNAAVRSGGSVGSYKDILYADAGGTSWAIETKVNTVQNYGTGVVLVKDADNFVVVTVQGELYYCQAGSFAGSVGGGTLLTFAAGDIFKVVVTPTSITLLRNGVQVRQFTSDGKMDGVTQDTLADYFTRYAGATKTGLWSRADNTPAYDYVTVTA